MPSKKQTASLHGNKIKPHSDLSHHYREIGIKAVAAAARKENNSTHGKPKRRESTQKEHTNE
jgi:hypothetical protein